MLTIEVFGKAEVTPTKQTYKIRFLVQTPQIWIKLLFINSFYINEKSNFLLKLLITLEKEFMEKI